jgi:hypothetical protein
MKILNQQIEIALINGCVSLAYQFIHSAYLLGDISHDERTRNDDYVHAWKMDSNYQKFLAMTHDAIISWSDHERWVENRIRKIEFPWETESDMMRDVLGADMFGGDIGAAIRAL